MGLKERDVEPQPPTPVWKPELEAPATSAVGAHSTTVDLGAAGSVTFTVSINPLAMTKNDRETFFKVADTLEQWQRSLDLARRGQEGADTNEVLAS